MDNGSWLLTAGRQRDETMTLPRVNDVTKNDATSTKQTWKNMMKAATQGDDDVKGDNLKGAEAFRSIVSQLAENTAMHGLPNATKAKTKQQKFFWIGVLVFGVVMIAYHLTFALIKYFEYPVSTTLNVVPQPMQEFPAITICNTNAIRSSRVKSSNNEAMRDLNSMISDAHDSGMTRMDSQMEGVNAGYDMISRMSMMMSNMTNDTDSTMNATDVMKMMTSGMDDEHKETVDAMMDGMDMRNMSTSDVMKMMDEAASKMMQNNMNGWDTMDTSCYTGRSSAMEMWFKYMQISSQMSTEERKEAGHQLGTMLLDCSFATSCCSPENFTHFLNSQYGNCYTFNSISDKPLKINREGPMFGLSLELYIEQDEYMEMLTDSAAVRLMIHNKTDMPFPDDQGLSIKPGTKTFIGIKKGEVKLADAPHGDCRDLPGDENSRRNAFLDDIPTIKYTSDACMKTCYQRNLIQRCGCGDNTFPMNGSNVAFVDVTQNQPIKPCNISNPELAACWRDVDKKHAANALGCDCPPACYRTHFEPQITSAEWPTIPNEDYVMRKIQLSSSGMMTKMRGHRKKDDQLADMRRNVLKVVVFYESLETLLTETNPSYDETALLSDIGGQVSLWLGLSVVTCFEILEFCGSLMRLSAKKCCRRKKDSRSRSVSPTQVQLSDSTANLWYSDKK